MSKERDEYMVAAGKLGLTAAEATTVYRAARLLHRIAEEECNGTLERDEATGHVYRVYGSDGPGPITRSRTADREAPARERIEAIAKGRGLVARFEGDPRGAVVTLCRPEDVKDEYNYRGLAVY